MTAREPCEHCGRRAACAHYPAYVTGFPARVDLAGRCIIIGQGIGSRAYDNCFEMGDGAFVVAALDRMAASDPALRAGIAREWRSPEAQAGWARTVASLAHIPTARLGRAATEHRHRERAQFAPAASQQALAL
jgi:hypothetical protein